MSFLRRLFEPFPDEVKLSRPPTVAERVGAAFSRVFGVFCAVATVLGILFLVLVGIPSWIVVPRSAAYRAATDYALTNQDLREHIGPVLECDGIPKYRRQSGEADFGFGVRGEIGAAWLTVHVERAATAPVEVWHVTTGHMQARTNGGKIDRDLKGR